MAPLIAAQWWALIALGVVLLIGAKLALVWFFVIRPPKPTHPPANSSAPAASSD